MMNFNLLPWRTILFEQQRRALKIIFCSAILFGIAISVTWHITLQHKIAHATKMLRALQQELTLLRQQEQQQKILLQQKITMQQQDNFVEQVENANIHNAELLIALGKVISPFIAFNTIQKNTNSISITGKTISLKSLANFMQKLSKIDWLDPPSVQEIKNNDINNLQNNSFVVQLANKNIATK